MSRILDKLGEFDDTLTVGELIRKLEAEQKTEKEKEVATIGKVKADFKDVYLKLLDESGLFGRTLEVYHIEEIFGSERTDRWELIYHIKGTKMSFSKGDISNRSFNERATYDTFSEEELRGMEVITKEQFEDYEFRHNMIVKQLGDLIESYEN